MRLWLTYVRTEEVAKRWNVGPMQFRTARSTRYSVLVGPPAGFRMLECWSAGVAGVVRAGLAELAAACAFVCVPLGCLCARGQGGRPGFLIGKDLGMDMGMGMGRLR